MSIDEVATETVSTGEIDTGLDHATRHRPWDRYLEMALGLRNYWYPAFFSAELAEGDTRMEEICGERILFKRIAGQIYGVQDRCLHRGVALSSRPECYTANTVTCWFHGFTYDVRDGQLVAVLSQPESALIGQVGLPTYPVREEFRTVWVYIGDGEPIPFEEELPRKLQLALNGEARRVFHPLVRVRIPCDWRLALENGFDPGHVYGHRNATVRGLQNSPMVRYPDRNTLRFEESPGVAKSMFTQSSQWKSVWSAEIDGVVVSAGGDPDAPQLRDVVGAPDVTEQGGGAAHMPCMYEANGFPDGKQTHFEWFVPIDEGHHMYTILQSVIVHSDEEETEFHRDADEKWGPLVWSMQPDIEGFNNFDAFGRAEVMHGYNVEDFWHKEYFYKPDFILTQWRMFVSKHARDVQKRTDMLHRPPLEESTVVYYNEPGTIHGGNA